MVPAGGFHHDLLGALAQLRLGGPLEIRLGQEEDGEEQTGAGEDRVHPEDPAPVGVGIDDEPGEDAAERAAPRDHDAVEADFRAAFVDKVQVGDDGGAERLGRAGAEPLQDARAQHRPPRLGLGVPDARAEEDGQTHDQDGPLADLERERDPEEVAQPQEEDIERVEVAGLGARDVELFDERDERRGERGGRVVGEEDEEGHRDEGSVFAQTAPGQRVFGIVGRARDEEPLEHFAFGVLAVEVCGLYLALHDMTTFEVAVVESSEFFVAAVLGLYLGFGFNRFHHDDGDAVTIVVAVVVVVVGG